MIFYSEKLVSLVKAKLRGIFVRSNKAGETILTRACKHFRFKFIKFLAWLGISLDTMNKKGETPLWATLNSRNKYRNNVLVRFFVRHSVNLNNGYGGNTPLTFAIKKNDAQLVKLLLEDETNKADINLKNAFGESPLILACYSDNLDIISLLINNGAKINCKNNKGVSPLWLAMMQNKLDMIKIFIDNKADINKEYGGETPLMFATRKGNLELVDMLIRNNADINHANIFKETALWKAMNKKKYDILKFLVKNNADINKQDFSGNTPIFIACQMGNMELVKLFLENNANLNIENENYETPVLIAAIRGYTDIAVLLIQNNADINKKDIWGRSVLSIACKTNNEILLKILVHKINEMGKTPLIDACEKSDFKLIKLFVQNGANVNIKIGSNTPLSIILKHLTQNMCNTNSFILRYYRKIVKYLINNGSNINTICGNSTPLLDIIPYDTELAKYLIDNGADVNMVVYDKTPLLESIIYNPEIARYLVTKGADVNKNVYNKFPLIEAIIYDKEIAKYLIDNGADVNVTNLKGETPLAVLINKYIDKSVFCDEQKDIELAKLLLANGADVNILYSNLEQKERRRFIKLLLEDDVVKTIIAIRNKNILDKKDALDNDAVRLLDKRHLGIVRKNNIEIANVIFRKKKLAKQELKL